MLHPAKIEEACARIADVRRKTEALAQIESNITRICPHCGRKRPQKWGKTRTKIQRYRCAGCKKTFTGRTGTRIERMHRTDLFIDVLKDMLEALRPSSIRVPARRLGLNKHTIWRWRIIALTGLAGISNTDFSGIVEADEKYQKEARKGSRAWVRYQRDPASHLKPQHMSWYKYGKKGVPMLRGLSKWQLPILTAADRSDACFFEHLPNRNHTMIDRVLSTMLAHNAVLCSDVHPAYETPEKARKIDHFLARMKPD